MENRYKVTISGRNLYKEVNLTAELNQVKVGTASSSDIRLYRDLFFGAVELLFVKNGEEWSVLCSDNLYLTMGDSRKLMTSTLSHGDILLAKYQNSDNEVFRLEFLIDFDSERRLYERRIDVAAVNSFSIGTAVSDNIMLGSNYADNDSILLIRTAQEQSYALSIRSARYGVYHNGKKAKNGEKIKNGDFFSLADYSFYYKNGSLWTEIRSDMTVSGLTYSDHPFPANYPKFNRNTRLVNTVNEEKIEILDPPAKPTKPKNNWLTKFLPSIAMLLAAGVMAFFGGAMIIMSAISAIMAVVTTVINTREGNKDYEKSSAERLQKYSEYIYRKRGEIQQCRAQEYQELEELYVSQNTELSRLLEFSSELFDRSRTDEDYLCLRIGSGAVESRRQVNFKQQEKLEVEDELQSLPEQVYHEFRTLANAPVVIDLKETNAVGIGETCCSLTT